MSDYVRRFLGISPYFEVMIRKAYWTSPSLYSASQNLLRLVQKPSRVDANTDSGTASFDDILKTLERFGVSPSGVLVVHSSMAELRKTTLTATAVIERLREFIGMRGTLAMPAIPRYDEEPAGIKRITTDMSTTILTYDVKRTLPWTGALPLKLMQRKDSIRSLHPLNSMVAVGPDAEEMMASNLDGERPPPCGDSSSWNYCLEKGAKIAFLGVDVAHSLTMIHVAEDCYMDTWPIANWYRDRIFRIVEGKEERMVTVRERHPMWAMHYAERTLARDLLRLGIQKCTTVSGISVSVIDAKELLGFLNSRKASGYPYYMWKSDRA